VKLIEVEPSNLATLQILYRLLEERDPETNISHKEMPSFEEHVRFVAKREYLAWYLIEHDGEYIGATYLTRAREIGIFLFKAHQGKKLGRKAVEMLMERHPGKFLANMNPSNSKSARFFRNLGFDFIQCTYAK
jgi:RimJ/RimL family protein N-acetyltransferase